jgi:uncharacterized membrane protein
MDNKSKAKKDRMFIVVMSIIVANLFYILVQLIPYLAQGGYRNFSACALTFANILGIVGAIWLVRNERRNRKIEQGKEDETKEE